MRSCFHLSQAFLGFSRSCAYGLSLGHFLPLLDRLPKASSIYSCAVGFSQTLNVFPRWSPSGILTSSPLDTALNRRCLCYVWNEPLTAGFGLLLITNCVYGRIVVTPRWCRASTTPTRQPRYAWDRFGRQVFTPGRALPKV
ncbi:hypothetical protein GY45DRAFT_817291 [Cubamyces sp. BRFM 1775]|nr:hypothetical protein GY45DRAFT_817291 [Cubamyces sp. BRFM 1775]